MSPMRSRAFRAAAVALALVASATAARAGGSLTSLPAGTLFAPLNNIGSVPSGYTFVEQQDNNGVKLSNGATVNLDQLVYKNASGQLGFLYQLTAVSASARNSVMGFDTSNFSTFTSGNGTGGAPLSAGFFGGPSNLQVFGSRPDADGRTVGFVSTPLTTSGSSYSVFVATTATQAALTGSTSITPNGSGASSSVTTFQPVPEPGALALAFLGVPFVATACYRRWGSRPQRA